MAMERTCVGCGGALERGSVQARNLVAGTDIKEPSMVVAAFSFVRPGVPTSPNLVKAFLQGVRDEPTDEWLPVAAYRCVGCGRLELYAGPEEGGQVSQR
jgi:hypothetical protein